MKSESLFEERYSSSRPRCEWYEHCHLTLLRERWDIRITWRDVIINRHFDSTPRGLVWEEDDLLAASFLEVCFCAFSFASASSFVFISFSFFRIRFMMSSFVIFKSSNRLFIFSRTFFIHLVGRRGFPSLPRFSLFASIASFAVESITESRIFTVAGLNLRYFLAPSQLSGVEGGVRTFPFRATCFFGTIMIGYRFCKDLHRVNVYVNENV